MMNDLKSKMDALRNEYLGRLAGQIAQIRSGLEVLATDGGDAAVADLIAVTHKLSGSGGTFGFPLISRLASDMEMLLEMGNRDIARLGRIGDGLKTILDAGGNLEADAEVRLLEDLSSDLIEEN